MSANAPGAYPGNPALPREVREKILSTFRHTLNLYQTGKLDDCLIGCDFILKMDPRFVPARQLLDKARNPRADVDLRELEAVVAETAARRQTVAAADADRLLVRALESFNARDFDAAIAAANEVLAALPDNRDARGILEKAQRKKEAQPQFDASRKRALAALEASRGDEARRELERMRALDSDHPAVALLERRIGAAVEPAIDFGGPDASVFRAEIAGVPSEPDLAFDGDSTNPTGKAPVESGETSGGLEALSLDSLTLDEGPSAPGSSRPLVGSSDRPSAEVPGSPGDLWSQGPEETEPEVERVVGHGPSALDAETEAPSAQDEIEVLLRQGDEAASKGDRQQAIEMWSRIFLIDINNTEAVVRIERTRQEMAEGNRRIAEGLKKGKDQFEAGDLPGARVTFLEVLAIDENEPTARAYLDRIEQELAHPSAPADLAESVRGDVLAEEMAEPVVAAPPIAPELEAPRRAARWRARPRVVGLVAVFFLLVAAGAFLVVRLPGTGPAPARDESAPSLERATLLFREGKVAETVAELKRIAPEHPDYARARKLLVSLTRPAAAPDASAPATGESALPAPAPAIGANDPARLREQAEKALAEKRFIEALKAFNEAAPAFPGDPTFTQAMAAAAEKVTELTPAVKLYNEGEYESAIPILWRIYQVDRGNRDARSYLLRAYYNQGVTQLQNGLYEKAKGAFHEALALDPQDTDAARHRKFAERYQKGDLDLLGRIYVRHLQQRP